MKLAPAADDLVVRHTRSWVESIVIGCNFCPFAQREMARGSVRFQVVRAVAPEACLQALVDECVTLDRDPAIETTLVIYPDAVQDFDDFLGLLELAEALLPAQGYEGIYQLASFHPQYCFAGAGNDDAANYTNRSPYPVLHLLREASLARALASYPHPEKIPEQNIDRARRIGLAQLQARLDACRKPPGD